MNPFIFSPSALSSLAHGSPEGGQRGRGEHASQKQVVEGGVAGGWMLAFGVGRWSWALVWATVSGEERAQGWGRVRENGKREGRGERIGRGQPRVMEKVKIVFSSRGTGTLCTRASVVTEYHRLRGLHPDFQNLVENISRFKNLSEPLVR